MEPLDPLLPSESRHRLSDLDIDTTCVDCYTAPCRQRRPPLPPASCEGVADGNAEPGNVIWETVDLLLYGYGGTDACEAAVVELLIKIPSLRQLHLCLEVLRGNGLGIGRTGA